MENKGKICWINYLLQITDSVLVLAVHFTKPGGGCSYALLPLIRDLCLLATFCLSWSSEHLPLSHLPAIMLFKGRISSSGQENFFFCLKSNFLLSFLDSLLPFSSITYNLNVNSNSLFFLFFHNIMPANLYAAASVLFALYATQLFYTPPLVERWKKANICRLLLKEDL